MTQIDVTTKADDPGRPPLHILLVEDSRSGAALTLAALRGCARPPTVDVARDGEATMDFLHRRDPFGDVEPVDLVILDLNLPRMDGREVLQAMKNDDALRTIPVIVLTSSSADSDISAAYRLHANAFITKPVGLEQFLDAIRGIEAFWMSVARLP